MKGRHALVGFGMLAGLVLGSGVSRTGTAGRAPEREACSAVGSPPCSIQCEEGQKALCIDGVPATLEMPGLPGTCLCG